MPVVICASLILACASMSRNGAEVQIRALEAEWNASRLAGDAPKVADLLDDEWTAVHVDGRVERKDTYVDGIASGGRHILSINVMASDVRVFGGTAIVTGEVVQRGFRRGELRVGTLRFTHIWVRRGTKWRMLRSHSTEVVQSTRPPS